jgi:hypothetical protein
MLRRPGAGVVPGSPSTGNGSGGRTCAVAGCRTLPVDWRAGVCWRGLDGRRELLAGQRGGRLAASPLDPLRSTARTWTPQRLAGGVSSSDA